MNKNIYFKKILSILMCICFIFVSLVLTTYIVEEINHKCTNENCTICEWILKAERIIKLLSSGVACAGVAGIIILNCLAHQHTISHLIKVSTPITLKVKMLN